MVSIEEPVQIFIAVLYWVLVIGGPLFVVCFFCVLFFVGSILCVISMRNCLKKRQEIVPDNSPLDSRLSQTSEGTVRDDEVDEEESEDEEDIFGELRNNRSSKEDLGDLLKIPLPVPPEREFSAICPNPPFPNENVENDEDSSDGEDDLLGVENVETVLEVNPWGSPSPPLNSRDTEENPSLQEKNKSMESELTTLGERKEEDEEISPNSEITSLGENQEPTPDTSSSFEGFARPPSETTNEKSADTISFGEENNTETESISLGFSGQDNSGISINSREFTGFVGQPQAQANTNAFVPPGGKIVYEMEHYRKQKREKQKKLALKFIDSETFSFNGFTTPADDDVSIQEGGFSGQETVPQQGETYFAGWG